jgi:hypothetical protein
MASLVVRAVRSPTYVGWGSIGFVVLATLLTRQVWWRFFDITRATAPVITAYVLVTFVVAHAAASSPSEQDSVPRRP